jgi:hypothetical protein
MVDPVASITPPVNWIRVIARVLAVCWAGFWVLFLLYNLAAGLTARARTPLRWDGGLFIVLGLVVVVVPTLLAWRGKRVGGMALVIVGVACVVIGIIRPPGHLFGSGLIEALLMQALLPIVAGVLFLACGRKIGLASGS